MRILASLILALGLCSCTVPTVVAEVQEPDRDVELPPTHAGIVRIGVEYLPPEQDSHSTWHQGDDEGLGSDPGLDEDRRWTRVHHGYQPRRRSLATSDPESVRARRRLRETNRPSGRWRLLEEDIAGTDSAVERFALRFLNELMGDDRKRVERALGQPLLAAEQRLSAAEMSNFLDERDREDHQRLLTKNGTRMLRRPLRNAAKELPLFRDVEVALDEIRQQNVSMQTQRRKLGRVTVRLRGSRLEDPVELAWIHRGFRVGSSRTSLKVSYSKNFSPRVAFRLRSRYDYDDYDLHLLGTVEYRINDYTRLNLLAGNGINPRSGPTTYPGGPTSDSRDEAVMLFVEHRF